MAPMPGGRTPDEICSFQHIRVVQSNNTVRIGGQIIDIPKHRCRATFAKAIVVVRHLLQGGYRVYYKGELIAEAKGPPCMRQIPPGRWLPGSGGSRHASENERQGG